ncbi:cell division protein FtsZ [Marivita sp.]|uniref:cell division protein FtsZ n=1 Tax=Marivita sp. TaxID=2003365 RepID=UPI0025C2967B|nr:cell division protein FtsZ [Marivita sp.]
MMIFEFEETPIGNASMKVVGVGGAGGNAVNRMIDEELEGVEFISMNTDGQALKSSCAQVTMQIGKKLTRGLGAGARPEIGRQALHESEEEVRKALEGADLVFITAGMGGGTGTGAAPIIAQAARELGVLTVGVVTKPFQFEGGKRMKQAEDGVEALQKVVDTLIIIPNQNLFRLANEKTTFTEAFSLADDVLYQGVKGVTDLMVRPGLINLDFADVRAVMDEMGKAMMGTGEAEGEDRAIQAAEKAIANPLLDEISLRGAKGVLINITGGHDLTLFELDEAANRIREEVDTDANIIVGSTLDDAMEGTMRVSVVATGIDVTDVNSDMPVPRRKLSQPLTQVTQAEEARYDAPEQQQPEPVAARAAEPAAQEPSLFGSIEAERAAAQDQMETIFEQDAAQQGHDGTDDDGLPAPAYRPQVAEFNPREDSIEADPEQFVAPRAPSPGTPSAEALARLQAAAARTRPAPGARPNTSQFETEPEDGERPRFGINSLINRMTGHSQGNNEAPVRRTTQPPVQSSGGSAAPAPAPAPAPEPEADEDQERIEIPAFLRRQAN